MTTGVPPALTHARFPLPVRHVLERLAAAGHRSWLVGGAVRDLLLHRPREAADFDVATPAPPDEVMRLFRRVIPTGIDHGTVTVVVDGAPIEVTTFRGEGEYVDGRRPSSVTFLADIEGDLSRRDFTMNALAYDPLGHELRDPFGGHADLRRKVIRAVGDPAARFAEDGLRPMRAARFAAQLGFALERATREAIPSSLSVTARISAERVCDELSRLLLAPHVGRGLDLLDSTGLLQTILPEVSALETEARAHAFRAVEELARSRRAREPAGEGGPSPLALRLAALLHAIATDRSRDAALHARGALERLRFPTQVIEDAAALVSDLGCLMNGPREAPRGPADARRWLSRVGRRLARPALTLWRACARSLPRGATARRAVIEQQRAARSIRRVLGAGPPLSTADLALDGRAVMAALGIPPGKDVGDALRHLLAVVLEDPRRNRRPALEEALRTWWAKPPESR